MAKTSRMKVLIISDFLFITLHIPLIASAAYNAVGTVVVLTLFLFILAAVIFWAVFTARDYRWLRAVNGILLGTYLLVIAFGTVRFLTNAD